MEHQLVALAVLEERHVADAGVAGLALELDALRVEVRARLRDIGDAQRDVRRVRRECPTDQRRIDQIQRDVAGLDLGEAAVPVRTVHAERVPVERLGPLHVLDRHGVEVGSLDPHRARD